MRSDLLKAVSATEVSYILINEDIMTYIFVSEDIHDTICSYMGIQGYGLNIEDISNLHIWT